MELSFLTAADYCHNLFSLPQSEVPTDVERLLLIGQVEVVDARPIDDAIDNMKVLGLPFAWIQHRHDQPPYALIDLQHDQTRIIPPPFFYLKTPDVAAMAATTGLYIQLLADDPAFIDQVWSPKHGLTLDDNGMPLYDDRPILSVEQLKQSYCSTMH